MAAVTCLERFAHCAVGVEVKVNAELLDFEHVAGAFLDELFNCFQIVFVLAGDQRIGDVQLVVITRQIEHAGYSALRQRAVRKLELAL